MPVRLQEMAVGDSGRVVGYGECDKIYRKKLLSMGLTPGVEFSVTRYAPMGDPVEIQVRGFSLSLRKTEAQALLVEKV
ncbi:MAG: ferrous iron transport protein A [Gammaproteobacteria bacterium]|nr:ferrous iron transport protein A [Gammaproteobacteria bacterium]MCP5458665.1 ferrous iron transport protein A [Gammaproteobacteria bacterium]